MPRCIPGPIPGEMRKYAPDVEIDGWRNLDDSLPVTVWIRQPTEGEKRHLVDVMSARNVTYTVGGEVEKVDLLQDEKWRDQAIEAHVSKVENYTDAAGRPIVTGKDLAEHGEALIVFQVAAEIIKDTRLSEDERKNSARSSDS